MTLFRGLVIAPFITFMFAFVIGCSESVDEPAATYTPTDTVKKLYQQNCLVCHGVAGGGDGQAALGLKQPLLAFNSKVNVAKVSNLIADGKGQMPSWSGHLSSQQITQLANYVVYLAK